MKRVSYLLLIIPVLILASGCASFLKAGAPGPITGTWEGQNQQGSKITMIFKEDHTMHLEVDTDKGTISSIARFRIDYSRNPNYLDLYEIKSSGKTKSKELQAVISFPADSRMIYIGEIAANGTCCLSATSDIPSMMHIEMERIE